MATIHLHSRAYRLVAPDGLAGAGLGDLDRRVSFHHRDAAAAFLARALAADAGNVHVLRRFAATALHLYDPARHEDRTLVEHLARGLATGRLHLVAVAQVVLGAVDGDEPVEDAPVSFVPAPPSSRPEKTWIEIELLGDDDQPIVGERYRIKLTDESIRTGHLDDRGRARFDGIDPGVCTVWFPDVAGSVSGLARTAGPDTPGKTWIEIELLGDDGAPITGERYELRVPGGRTEAGRLDEFGSAYHDNLDPGTCYVCFPDVTPGCWEAA